MRNYLANYPNFTNPNASFNYAQLINYYGELEVHYYYFLLNNEIPSIVSFYDSIDHEGLFNAIIEEYGVKSQDVWLHTCISPDRSYPGGYMIQLRPDVLVAYNSREYYVRIYHNDKSNPKMLEDLKKIISSYFTYESGQTGKIFLLYEMSGYLYLKDFAVKNTNIDLNTNYNEDLKPFHENVIEKLNTPDDKGIVLLHGLPGTGKTHYIRYLTTLVNKKMIYIPPEYAAKIASPHFLPLMIQHPNSVLIVEDAESIIQDRTETRNDAVSSLLNIADGLLSDCLSLQIICTFNVNLEKIDQALLRKGRLIGKYEFGALEKSKAQNLSDSLGFRHQIETPSTLAEIYNQAK
jgi:ATPase family associated with various cellular activities (AAA)